MILEPAHPIEEDARLVMQWRNDPLTLAMSFHQTPKKWPEFLDEFSEKYFSPDGPPPCFGVVDGQRVGFVRFRPYPELNAFDISIMVVPEQRGRGHGKRLLELGTAFLHQQGIARIVAEIKPENEVSLRLFQAEGYTEYDQIARRLSDLPEPIPVVRLLHIKYRAAGLFSREPGLSVLRTLFTPNSEFELVCLFTNRREPATADPARPDRPEFAVFKEIAEEKGYPFYTVDTYGEAREMQGLRDHLPFDFIFSVSWAFLVPSDVLVLPQIAAINQHRGKLPDYPRAIPVKRALQNGDSTIILSTHLMSEAYDEGQMLIETPLPANYDAANSLDENVERIKRELLPLYSVALIEAARQMIMEKSK